MPIRSSRDVEVLSWPQDAERLDALRAAGRPRLLLVPAGVVPPMGDDVLEDWVRLPVPAEDLWLRRRRLARLASEAAALAGPGSVAADARRVDPGREVPVP